MGVAVSVEGRKPTLTYKKDPGASRAPEPISEDYEDWYSEVRLVGLVKGFG